MDDDRRDDELPWRAAGGRDGSGDPAERFLSWALAGEARQGTRLVVGLADEGRGVEDVITGVLSRTQATVGDRWHLNRCSVADEHLATAVTTSALEAISDHLEPEHVVGRVAVACAEGDWHSVPARMFCELLRSRGWNVWFLGASTPADDLGTMLARKRPDALVVSCAVASSFLGVERMAVAAHEQGVPVLAGGRAFGRDGRRAHRLGADGWAADLDAAVERLSSWVAAPPTIVPVPVPRSSVVELARSAGRIADHAVHMLVAFGTMLGADERALSVLRGELTTIVEHLAAALLVDDPAVFIDHIVWLDEHHAVRGVPPSRILHALAAIRPDVLAVHPAAASLLELGASTH